MIFRRRRVRVEIEQNTIKLVVAELPTNGPVDGLATDPGAQPSNYKSEFVPTLPADQKQRPISEGTRHDK
jgi:hypothetical protein